MRQGKLTIRLDEDGDLNEFSTNYETVFGLIGDDDDDLLPIHLYWDYCRRFAAVLGFSEKTIEEWFGNF